MTLPSWLRAAYTLAQPKGKMGKVGIPDPMPSIPSSS